MILSCETEVQDTFPICMHNLTKKCGKPFTDYKCEVKVDVILKKCSHQVTKKCYKEENQIQCHHECKKIKNCGHLCKSKCGSNHDCNECHEEIEAKFKNCGHPTKKQCTKPITWICQKKIPVTLSCKHEIVKVRIGTLRVDVDCHMGGGAFKN